MSDNYSILHLSTPLSWRGGEQQLYYLVNGLNSSFESHVACKKKSVLQEKLGSSKIPTLSLRSIKPAALPNARKISRYARKNNIRLIHAHDAKAHTLAILAADVNRLNLPVVVSRRVDFAVKSTWLSKYKYNHPAINKIICVSETIKEITGKSIKDKSRLRVIHSGIDLDRFKMKPDYNLRADLNIPDDHKIVGNTAALADHKDYFTWLHAAKKMQIDDEKITFVIVGKGSLEEKIKARAKKINLEHLHFMGFREDVHHILPQFDLFMMSSKTEGLGTSLLDAMGAGIPIVSTTAGGIPEIISNKVNGLLVPVRGDIQLAKSALRILHDPELAEKLKQNGFERVKDFSKENMTQKTADIYREILEK